MLTKTDIERTITEVEETAKEIGADCPNWHYWKDSGEYNVWVTADRTYLLQVSHEQNRMAVTRTSAATSSETLGNATLGWDHDDEVTRLNILAYLAKPEMMYDYLSELDESYTTAVEMTSTSGGEA